MRRLIRHSLTERPAQPRAGNAQTPAGRARSGFWPTPGADYRCTRIAIAAAMLAV